MPIDLSADETIVVATYSNWNEAEIARSFLEDEGIRSYITGQEPHRAPELVEGVHLRVLQSTAERAADALREADLLPSPLSEDDREQAAAAHKRLVLLTILVILALGLLSVIFNVL